VRVFISADMEGVTGVTHPQDGKGITDNRVFPANLIIHGGQYSRISAL
jgi:D-aminopeptidase